MLTPEQAKNIKEQLLAHVEKGFPEDKKDYARKQIESMDAEQIEEFLKKNQLAVSQGAEGAEGKCIFCSIVSGELPSYKIAENSDAIAVLEINPLTRGHVLVIPREHIDSAAGGKLPAGVKKLADEIATRIKEKLKPEDVVIKSSNAFGHEILNVLPLYKEDLSKEKNERYSASQEELLSLEKLLKESPKPKKTTAKPKTKKISRKKMILPRRIP